MIKDKQTFIDGSSRGTNAERKTQMSVAVKSKMKSGFSEFTYDDFAENNECLYVKEFLDAYEIENQNVSYSPHSSANRTKKSDNQKVLLPPH